MIEQKFGSRRCRNTRRPHADQCPDVVFYRCRSCNDLFPVTGGQAFLEKKILYCNEEAERLAPTDVQGVKEFLELSHQATGGYSDSAVKVFWKTKRQECVPQWIYLKTFIGSYLKCVIKGERSPVVFMPADTDAFCYCDGDPYLECVFRRERGSAVCAYSERTRFLGVPLDRMTTHWQTREKETEE